VSVGDRSFAAAAPRLWNTLPDDITSAPSLSVLRHKLKTFLFQKSYLDIILQFVMLLVFSCCVTVVMKFPTQATRQPSVIRPIIISNVMRSISSIIRVDVGDGRAPKARGSRRQRRRGGGVGEGSLLLYLQKIGHYWTAKTSCS